MPTAFLSIIFNGGDTDISLSYWRILLVEHMFCLCKPHYGPQKHNWATSMYTGHSMEEVN